MFLFAEQVEEAPTKIRFIPKRVAMVTRTCRICQNRRERKEFQDAEATREWQVSRICQACQIEIFGDRMEPVHYV
jgi:hypothetical protein